MTRIIATFFWLHDRGWICSSNESLSMIKPQAELFATIWIRNSASKCKSFRILFKGTNLKNGEDQRGSVREFKRLQLSKTMLSSCSRQTVLMTHSTCSIQTDATTGNMHGFYSGKLYCGRFILTQP